MSSMIVIGGKAGVGGQMSDHTWCLGIRRVCGDKTSCPPRQLNGGCMETAPGSILKRLHRAGGFYHREFNVTPASRQHSSRRQQ